jgi:hypothetical protein
MARQPQVPQDLSDEDEDQGLQFIGKDSAPADAGASRRDDRRAHDTRVDEVSEERATHQSRKVQWQRPSSLDAPPARPGYKQRWIRVSFRGADDPRNRNRRLREGWNPRPLESISADWQGIGANAGSVTGAFVVDDLMLCEMPESIYNERKAHYQAQTALQMTAVEADLEQAQVGGHRILRNHTTAVTHPARVIGRKVDAAVD